MMNAADDESQLVANSFESNLNLKQKMPSSNSNSTNNLISEAFNLNVISSQINPFTVLPPSSNHFQPIQSINTSSVDTPAPTSSFFDQLGSNNAKKAPATSFLAPNPSLISNLTNQSNIVLSPPISNSLLEQSALQAPPTSASVYAPVPTKQTTNLTSNLSPPISIPPPPMPIKTLPPPTSTSTSTSTNPYSAKGALNKKVYDNNLVNVAPVTGGPPTSAMLPTNIRPTSEFSESNLFMPPAPPSQPVVQPLISPSLSSQSSTSSLPSTNIQHSLSSNQLFLQSTVAPPPTPQTPLYQQSASSFQIATNIPEQPFSSNNNNPSASSNSNANNKMWNWFKSAPSGLVSTFVEKAKHSVDAIVTTIDPQMKDYMHPANKPIFLVSSISNARFVHTIKEAFNDAGFSKITIQGTDTQNSSQFAPQIVGYACALQSAKEKLENTLLQLQNSHQNHPAECTVLSFQDFLVELTTDCWFELAVIMLKDKANNLEFTVYTEAIPVSSDNISQLQQLTPNDYPFKYSGFSYRLPEKNFNFNSNSTFLNYETPDTLISQVRLSNALKTLAFLFKNKLISNLFN